MAQVSYVWWPHLDFSPNGLCSPTSCSSLTPSTPTRTTKGRAVVVIGVDRGGVGRGDGTRRRTETGLRKFAGDVSKITQLGVASLLTMLLHWVLPLPTGAFRKGAQEMPLLQLEHRINVEKVAQIVREEHL